MCLGWVELLAATDELGIYGFKFKFVYLTGHARVYCTKLWLVLCPAPLPAAIYSAQIKMAGGSGLGTRLSYGSIFRLQHFIRIYNPCSVVCMHNIEIHMK